MIDTISNTINFSSIWQFVGPLIGVGLGYLISDKVWDRQKQWEMRRDVVIDSVRALADLELVFYNVINTHNLHNALKNSFAKSTKEGEDALKKAEYEHIEAMQQHQKCLSLFQRAHTVADVAIGGELSRNLSGYFQFSGRFIQKVLDMKPIKMTAGNKELAGWHNRVILSARKALGIKDAGDLPVLDYDNQSPTTDN